MRRQPRARRTAESGTRDGYVCGAILLALRSGDQLLDRTYDFARRLAAAPPIQVALIKNAVRQAAHIDLGTHLDLISSHFAVVSSMSDYLEAKAAFQEGRSGDYQGR